MVCISKALSLPVERTKALLKLYEKRLVDLCRAKVLKRKHKRTKPKRETRTHGRERGEECSPDSTRHQAIESRGFVWVRVQISSLLLNVIFLVVKKEVEMNMYNTELIEVLKKTNENLRVIIEMQKMIVDEFLERAKPTKEEIESFRDEDFISLEELKRELEQVD